MPHHGQLHHLLKDLSAIDYVYQKQKANQRFNVFSVLMKASDEVRLHSRFLAELLDPKGSHMMGSAFLQALLGEETLKTTNDDTLPQLKERAYKTEREKNNIDILIKQNEPNLAIIIENKIHAEDQERQLERYYDTIKDQNYSEDQIAVCYLSLWAQDEPSEQSLGSQLKEKKVNHLTYEGTIIQWLEKCIGLAAKKPALRESIIQYQNIVKRLTGQTMNNEQFNEVYELLKKDENILVANQLASNWKSVKKNIELQFWQDLEDKIGKKYQIIEFGKFDENKIEKAHTGPTNKDNKGCGLAFQMGAQYQGYEACFMIKRSWGPGVPVFYGLRLLDNNELLVHESEDLAHLGNLPSNKFFFRQEFNPNNPIYFDVFNETALQLIKEDFRAKFIEQALEELESTIKSVKKVIEA